MVDRPIPAGLWQRTAAWTLDAAIIAVPSLLAAWPLLARRTGTLVGQTDQALEVLGLSMGRAIMDGTPLPALAMTVLHDPALRQAIATVETAIWSATWPAVLGFTVLSGVYHVAFERGDRQATPGQRLLGLHVSDALDRRLGSGRAVLRHLAGTGSWLSLNLGHAMAAVPPTHRALHDHLSQTRVWASSNRVPVWAVCWLALLATLQLVLTGWWAATAMAAMQHGLEQSLL